MIYVHVPFCRSFCTYCDFYSEVAPRCRKADDVLKQEALFGQFAQALAAEIRARKNEIQGACACDGPDTLYIGGGTPSVLPLDVYGKLLDALSAAGVGPGFEEFTFEVNPEDIVEKGPAYVEGLLGLGVNRISMGVQSFDDGILRFMNRRHSSAEAVRAYHILEEVGVENISIDLIFGLPQLSDSLWRETLDKALDISFRGMAPRHISSYQLSVEPGSMLARMVEKGTWSEASDELCQKQYCRLCEVLGAAGYHHYEISNFALPGSEAVHNSAYWRHVPYIGLGPGAHSFYEKTRQWNRDSLKEYLEAGDFEAVRQMEMLDGEQVAMEKVMLGLRTSCGLPENVLRQCCEAGAVDRALASGDLVRTSVADSSGHDVESVRIPESRFFVSDSVIASLI